MEYIVKAGLVNVEEQLAEMAIGIRHQFDLAGVALAMGSAGLSSEIKIANPLERSIVADLSVAAMGGVVRGRIDVENLAIQLISDSARYAVQQSYANSSSEEYHQSQRASRGEGPITQTTIEQQWESQLINDAEFTANTLLPSVTFDVNNSYVAEQLGQRVGEEVSHFYHPTPPPPRNPTGFWRGVDDVVKMQEGTRKVADLFFTGHYEAPRDSWETLGFIIGTPIAFSSMAEMGVERLGAEAIDILYQGSQQLGKGLMQASRLMNRWGLFGHNGVESSIFGARGVVSGRAFDEAAAGGELRDLVGTQSRIKFTHQGVDVVKAHTSRFGADAANQYMINRLRAIANGEIPATTIDRNFYSHELREFVRYRRLGWGSGVPKSFGYPKNEKVFT